MKLKISLARLLRKLERYTRTDMVYLARTGFWSNAGTLFVTLASFLLYIVLSKYVPKDVYGTYQYLLSLGAVIGAFTLTGMNSAVTRAVALGYEGALRTAVALQIRWSVLPLLLAWTIGGYYLYHGNTTLGIGLLLIGVFVPLNNAFNTYAAYLQAKHDFRRGFLYSLWWNVPYYSIVACVAYFYQAALVLLAANLISQCIGLIIAYVRTLRVYKPNDTRDPENLRYGNHLSAMGLFNSAAAQIDTILAFQFLGPVGLAVYSFATAIPDRVSGLLKFVPAAAFPKLVGKPPRSIRGRLVRQVALGTLVSAVLAGIYVLVAPYFFGFFFREYLEAVPYSQWYALVLVTGMSGVLVNALVAHGNVRNLYVFNTVNPLMLLGIQAAGVIFYGLPGLIASRIIGSVWTFVLSLTLFWNAK